jgi:hypothetical protein
MLAGNRTKPTSSWSVIPDNYSSGQTLPEHLNLLDLKQEIQIQNQTFEFSP